MQNTRLQKTRLQINSNNPSHILVLAGKSKRLFTNAKKVIPSGVNSPVRHFEPYPFFAKDADGSHIRDEDGNEYIDLCNGYGAMLFGHRRRSVMHAVSEQMKRGTMFCTPTASETHLACLITKTFPSMQKVRLVNTGGEATMTAIRLARGFTKRKKIIKFEGCYHGAHDSVLVMAGSGSAHEGIPVSDGCLDEVSKNTLVVPYNDPYALEKAVRANKNDIAGVIVEPIMANMGLVLPEPDFLPYLRSITSYYDIPLIFDEVVTGFRTEGGGAQQAYGITPDITTLGKALGSGFPIAAVGGRKDIMDMLSPGGRVYQASTFAGNPISVSAAIASITTYERTKERLHLNLQNYTENIVVKIMATADDLGIPCEINHTSSMFQVFFTDRPVTDYASSKRADAGMFDILFKSLLKHGVFVAPSQFETVFLSDALSIYDRLLMEFAYGEALQAVSDWQKRTS